MIKEPIGRKSNPKIRRALTLIEILIAMGILALSMIPIAGMIGFGFKGSAKDLRGLAAIQLAESTLGAVLVASYSAIPVGNGQTAPISFAPSPGSIFLGDIPKYQTVFTVSLDVEEITADFAYRPVQVENPSYVAAQPSTWVFDPTRHLIFDGSTTSLSKRVKKVQVQVNWVEPQKNRSIKMVTYMANMNG